MKRIILAGLFAGVALFAWESVAHMATPLGDAGLKALANEQPVLTALKDNVKEPGFYFFPAPEDRPGMTSAEKRAAMTAAMERWRTGPAGIMIFHPNGTDSLTLRQMLVQFGADIIAMLIAAFLLAQAAAAGYGYGRRLAFVVLMGLLPTLQAELPNWNWYGFPTSYLLAQLTVHLLGFAIAGSVLAKIVKPQDSGATRAAAA